MFWGIKKNYLDLKYIKRLVQELGGINGKGVVQRKVKILIILEFGKLKIYVVCIFR